MNKIGSKAINRDVKQADVFVRFKRRETYLVKMVDLAKSKLDDDFQWMGNMVAVNDQGRVWTF